MTLPASDTRAVRTKRKRAARATRFPGARASPSAYRQRTRAQRGLLLFFTVFALAALVDLAAFALRFLCTE
jgi:hypothetical protein